MSAQGDVARGPARLADEPSIADSRAVGEAEADPAVTRAARGYPGGLPSADPGPAETAIAHAAAIGQASGRGGRTAVRRARSTRGSGGGQAAEGGRDATGAAGRRTSRQRRSSADRPSVWQQAWDAWAEAGVAWQQPADWAPGVLDHHQHTEPIPVVRDIEPSGTGPDAARSPVADPDAPGPRPRATPRKAAGRGGRRGRRPMIAVAVVIVLAVAAVGLHAWNSAAVQPSLGALAGLPAAQVADTEFAPGPAAGTGASPTLTGIISAGADVVAFGSQPGVPARPLFLFSPDGGRTWRVAGLAGRPVGAAVGATPVMAAGGAGKWLALGPGAAWTSTDGSTWTAAPGIGPLVAGDRVLALARASGGFVVVGENVGGQGTGRALTPVLWTSPDGTTWQRRGAGQLHLAANGQVGALSWVAARGDVVVMGGDVARTTVQRRGSRKVATVSYLPGLWRSADGGVHWTPVNVPATHGASRWLGGIAAGGRVFVAVRPGRTAAGRPDIVVFESAQGVVWRFAGKLAGGALRLGAVAGSDDGVVVLGSIGARQVGFVTTNGRRWQRSVRLGAAQSVSAATAGPGGSVVVAGARKVQASPAAPPGASPFLLLAGPQAVNVGQQALDAAARTSVVVRGLGAAAGREVAVGSADGGPAIWTAISGGRWSPADIAAGAAPDSGLTSVAHGGAGWLAIGGNEDPASAGRAAAAAAAGAPYVAGSPAALVSPDGRTWTAAPGAAAFAAPGAAIAQAAAGESGYVVVGEQIRHGQPVAAAWWSATLGGWTPLGPVSDAPSAMLAVASGRTGFAAVGAIGERPGVWLSGDGRAWTGAALPLPPGAVSAALFRVVEAGPKVVAVGAAVSRSGAGVVPFAAVSADAGRTWHESVLPDQRGQLTATALTAVSGGFVAAGLRGAPWRQRAAFWWSSDGRGWHLVSPAHQTQDLMTQQVTALQVVGSTLTGVGYQASWTQEHPMLWLARTR